MELKEGQTVIFKNKNKKKDVHPDARGYMVLNGVEYEISLWNGVSKKNGSKYSSGNVALPYIPSVNPDASDPEKNSSNSPKRSSSGDLPW